MFYSGETAELELGIVVILFPFCVFACLSLFLILEWKLGILKKIPVISKQ